VKMGRYRHNVKASSSHMGLIFQKRKITSRCAEVDLEVHVCALLLY